MDDSFLLPLNRLLYVVPDTPTLLVGNALHAGALPQLALMAQQLSGTADFMVLDGAVQQERIGALRNQLSLSSVWFDVTNGAAFAAHSSDGLDFSKLLDSIAKVGKCFQVKRMIAYAPILDLCFVPYDSGWPQRCPHRR